jgi:hypothetical protein
MSATTSTLQVLAGVVSGAASGWLSVRKVVGGESINRLIEAALRSEREVRMPVAVVAPDASLDRAPDLRGILCARGFRQVRIVAAEAYQATPGEILVYRLEGDRASELLRELVQRTGISTGLLYTAGRATPPAGDWTFANSPVTLFARLRELVAFVRADESRQNLARD